MRQPELIAFLSGLVSAMEAVQTCGLDISLMVTDLIHAKLPKPPAPGQFIISTGMSLPTPNSFEINLGLNTGKLDMVKEYKNRTGCYLLEAKKLCEEYFASRSLEFYRRS